MVTLGVSLAGQAVLVTRVVKGANLELGIELEAKVL